MSSGYGDVADAGVHAIDATAADYVPPVLHVRDSLALAQIGSDGSAAAGSGSLAGGFIGAGASVAAQSSDKTKNAQDQMNPALTRALLALNNQECADMYGTPKSWAKGFTPQSVLQGIVSGTKYGKVSWKDAGNQFVAKAIPQFPYIGASSVSLVINTAPSPGTNRWSEGNVDENAETLLHELGHAFNFIRGAGGFPISNLKEAIDPFAFDKEVKKKCFLKFVA